MTRLLYRLDAMAPEWVAEGPSWGAGVRWTCGVHLDHQITLHFANPLDGHVARRGGAPLVWRVGGSFSTLTVVTPLRLGDCFEGWLVGGEFLVSAVEH